MCCNHWKQPSGKHQCNNQQMQSHGRRILTFSFNGTGVLFGAMTVGSLMTKNPSAQVNGSHEESFGELIFHSSHMERNLETTTPQSLDQTQTLATLQEACFLTRNVQYFSPCAFPVTGPRNIPKYVSCLFNMLSSYF